MGLFRTMIDVVIFCVFVATSFSLVMEVPVKLHHRAIEEVDARRPWKHQYGYERIVPKVMIINMFWPEADIWYSNFPSSGYGNILDKNISLPGLSPLYPEVHCTSSGDVCQMTAGESEINAAASVSGLVLSDRFDFSSTYFLLGGIAGVNPKLGTLGSVAIAKYAVQVALQYEFDAREMPENFTTGYMAYGTYAPDEYPTILYGTEVMELNEALRDAAFHLASRAVLNDSSTTAAYRARYRVTDAVYSAATEVPSVLRCDTVTSDVYYSGTLLSEAFENTTMLWTNQSAVTYCMTAQEDSAALQVLMRADLAGLVDFSRVIVMRSGSDFDRPPPSITAFDHLRLLDQNGFFVAIENLYLAGVEIVGGIVSQWDCQFAGGLPPTNYIGDILGSLGGQPNFGPGSVFRGKGFAKDGSTSTGPIRRKRGSRAAGMK